MTPLQKHLQKLRSNSWLLSSSISEARHLKAPYDPSAAQERLERLYALLGSQGQESAMIRLILSSWRFAAPAMFSHAVRG